LTIKIAIVTEVSIVLVAAKWSIAEYHQMITAGILDDRRVELIRGEIVEIAPEGAEHSSYCSETVKYLRSLLGELAEVREAHPITLPDNSEPEPDVAIVRISPTKYRLANPQVADVYWLIEIANTTLAKDLGVKKDLYASVGVPEYWVLDLQNKILLVFSDLQMGEYRSRSSFTQGSLPLRSFNNLAIDLNRLLE
jgi:Uma2 family endonuclease